VHLEAAIVAAVAALEVAEEGIAVDEEGLEPVEEVIVVDGEDSQEVAAEVSFYIQQGLCFLELVLFDPLSLASCVLKIAQSYENKSS